MNNQILTTGDIANHWGCSREYVRSLIRNGKLKPKKRWDERERYRISLDEFLKIEHQLAPSNSDRERITSLAKAMGINRRYAKQYLD